MNSQQAFPLSWPLQWRRTDAARREAAPFFATVRGERSPSGYAPIYRKERSMESAAKGIINEVRSLGGAALVISTNIELRQDGLPFSNRRPPADPGAAVYFTLRQKRIALACDKWRRVEDNLWAIAKHIEALRGQERWGVGSVEQAFAGYTALPAPGESTGATWYAVLGVAHDAPFEVARAAYLRKAKRCHPDNGGNHEAQVRLNLAWDQARQAYGQL